MSGAAVTLHPHDALQRLQRTARGVGVVAAVLCAIGALVDPGQFFRSYLVAYMFWFGIALGSMAIVMIHHITGGAWGATIRRVLESSMRTLPVLALLFLPLVLGLSRLYEWARPDAVAHDALLQHKSIYLNVPFFLGRAALYFAAWIGVAFLLSRWSLAQDRTTDAWPARWMEQLSRGGLVLVGLTMSFASIDWIMSLEPHWYSTIYGILVMGGQVMNAMAFAIAIAALLVRRNGPLSGIVSASQFHDLGKLLLAFVMLWAYFAFSQLLIMWSANLPQEIPWYLNRLHGGWEIIGVAVIVFHFLLPFLLLLSRDLKRDARRLAIVAVGIMIVRFIDLFWMVSPAFHPQGLSVHWLDAATLAGVGGVWIWAFVWQLTAHPLVAVNDPSLPAHE